MTMVNSEAYHDMLSFTLLYTNIMFALYDLTNMKDVLTKQVQF